MSPEQRGDIHRLTSTLHDLGMVQMERGRAECISTFEECLALSKRIGDNLGVANCAITLGNAYLDIPSLRDLDRAEEYFKRSSELFDERDRIGQAKCMNQLGIVAYERFIEARAANRPESELLLHLNTALGYYQRALQFDPPDALHALAIHHNALGGIYAEAGDIQSALPHFHEAIRHFEAEGALYNAATVRRNVALALAGVGRLVDAKDYADAALRNFEMYGDRAANEKQDTREMIARIEQDLQAQGE